MDTFLKNVDCRFDQEQLERAAVANGLNKSGTSLQLLNRMLTGQEDQRKVKGKALKKQKIEDTSLVDLTSEEPDEAQ
eukprot:126405-Prymnesium_polylepis.1